MDGHAVDGDLGLVLEQKGERLVGKHVRPQVGMLVTMSAQGLERRKETGRSDPSRGGVGSIVRVNENWTVDVEWHSTSQTRQGYASGCVARGGKTRAFHLCTVPNNAILSHKARSPHGGEMYMKDSANPGGGGYSHHSQHPNQAALHDEARLRSRDPALHDNARSRDHPYEGSYGRGNMKGYNQNDQNEAPQQRSSRVGSGSDGMGERRVGGVYDEYKAASRGRYGGDSRQFEVERPLVLESQREPFVLPRQASR